MLENPITATPGSSRLSSGGSRNSPNLRRSLVPQIRKTLNRVEDRNDDEAERVSLVASEKAVATLTPASSRASKDTMSSSPLKEHYQGCLKLYAENKITKDNAWNLQLIDFMTTMLQRHDSRMENLQTASTVVDASAKIYSFRVDAVHHDVLMMAGGLTKVAQSKRGKKDDDNAQDDGAGENGAPAPTKKKKKRKGAIAANPETLNGDFDANDCIDPFFERLAATTGDVTSSNRAFNATLPINNKTLALILSTDDPFLEEIKENIPLEIDLSECTKLPSKLLPFTESDNICEPFTGFSITNWDPDTEDSENRLTNWVEENRLNLSQQALVFDANAEVEPIPQDEVDNDLFDDEPLGGIESEEECDVAVAACVARVAAAPPLRLTDMRPLAAGDARLEYSYSAQVVSAWAGPKHWRLKNNRASKMCATQSTAAGRLTVDATAKKPVRTKRQLDFLGAGLVFDSLAQPVSEYEPTPPAKIMISRKTLATGPTWNENNYKTPIDRGLDETYFRKLFLRRNVMMLRKRDEEASKVPAEPVTMEEARDYDYNNENDASYCPVNMQDGDDWGNEDATAAGHLHDQVKTAELEEIGEMLEPPTKVAKIFIPYAMRAKKLDMKQLKHCTWKMLTEKTPEGEKEDVQPTSFFSLYKQLPERLSGNTRESLSIPLALLSLLHIANEKGLILEKRDDQKDVGVLGLIKD